MVQLSQFDYRSGRVDLNALCIDNGLHRFLMGRASQGKSPALITFNNPPSVIGKVDVSEIPLDKMPLDTWIARVQKMLLQELGIHITSDDIRSLRESLVTSYLLHSCVSVASTKTQRGQVYTLVTKNARIVASLRLAPNVRKKGLSSFDTQFATSYEELRSGSFKAVTLHSDVDGVRLGKQTISARSARHLVPYYSVEQYAARLLQMLSRNRVILVFRDAEGVQKQLLTTLTDEVVADWAGTTIEGAEYTKFADWCDPASLGYMSLPDLSKPGHFVSVPILGIEAMHPTRNV